jgi:hypothetical protein
VTDVDAICTLNREERRAMGLTSAGIRELYEQAQAMAATEGCTCGVTRIAPTVNDLRTKHYAVTVFHALDCPQHVVNVMKTNAARAKRERRLRSRVARQLRRLRPSGDQAPG